MRAKLVNIHIPKTAGSSLRQLLSDSVGLTEQKRVPVVGMDQGNPELGHFEGLADRAKRGLPKLFWPGLRMMSGHFRYRDIVPVLAEHREEVALITTLRDPIRRTISDYCYSISAAHTGHREFQQNFPTFEHYTRNTGEMNKQFDFLKPFENAPLDVTIENALHNLEFIGLTESFGSDVDQLFDCLQLPRVPQRMANTNPNKEQAAHLFDVYNDMLQEILAPEIELYNALASRRRFPCRGAVT